jgi:hypothetical protein
MKKLRCAEGHARQFSFELFAFSGVGGFCQAIGDGEKAIFLRFFRGQAGLD